MPLTSVQHTARVAADVLASATGTTLWIPCKGASMVVFKWKHTGTAAPASQNVEWTAQPGVGTAGTPATGNLVSTTSALAFGPAATGGLRQVVLPFISATVPAAPCFAVEYVRANMVNAAGGTLTALECAAEVYYPDGSLAPIGAAAV